MDKLSHIHQIAVIASASKEIGYGHHFRTLSIIRNLIENISDLDNDSIIYFINKGSDAELIKSEGISYNFIDNLADLTNILNPKDGPVIFDSSDVDIRTLERFKNNRFCIILLDDKYNIEYPFADLVINYSQFPSKLQKSSIQDNKVCLGPDYFPLRDNFLNKFDTKKITEIQTLLITFGGSDPDDQTTRIYEILKNKLPNLELQIIIGPGYKGKILNYKQAENVKIYKNPQQIENVFSNADIAISGSGGTAYELAYLGVPSLLLVLSEDQTGIASILDKARAAINMGKFNLVRDIDILNILEKLIANPVELNIMKNRGQNIVDGNGAKRISDKIIKMWDQKHIH